MKNITQIKFKLGIGVAIFIHRQTEARAALEGLNMAVDLGLKYVNHDNDPMCQVELFFSIFGPKLCYPSRCQGSAFKTLKIQSISYA